MMKVATTTLVFCVAALLALGIVMLYSASMVQAGGRYLMMQLIWCGLGVAACVLAACLDYRLLKRFWWLPLAASVVLLAMVFIPENGLKVHGVRINGARRWLDFAGFRMQPSELAKIAVIVFLAWYCERYQRRMGTFVKGLVVPGAVVGVVLLLILIEPDVGATLLLAAVAGMMLVVAGVRLLYFIPPVAAGAAGVVWLLLNDPMRSERIYSWLNVEETRLGKGLQAYQAMIALGSGGPSGLGLGHGRQKLGWVPEHHTDFIFSIIGEELGLIATAGIVAAFLLIVVSGVFIASRSRDIFGTLLASGLTFLIGLQAFINIGVVTSALPNKGLSLPFISYGGSNLVVMLASVGLLLSIARHGAEPARSSRNPFEMEAARA